MSNGLSYASYATLQGNNNELFTPKSSSGLETEYVVDSNISVSSSSGPSFCTGYQYSQWDAQQNEQLSGHMYPALQVLVAVNDYPGTGFYPDQGNSCFAVYYFVNGSSTGVYDYAFQISYSEGSMLFYSGATLDVHMSSWSPTSFWLYLTNDSFVIYPSSLCNSNDVCGPSITLSTSYVMSLNMVGVCTGTGCVSNAVFNGGTGYIFFYNIVDTGNHNTITAETSNMNYTLSSCTPSSQTCDETFKG